MTDAGKIAKHELRDAWLARLRKTAGKARIP